MRNGKKPKMSVINLKKKMALFLDKEVIKKINDYLDLYNITLSEPLHVCDWCFSPDITFEKIYHIACNTNVVMRIEDTNEYHCNNCSSRFMEGVKLCDLLKKYEEDKRT